VNARDDEDPLIRAIAALPQVLADDTAARDLRARCRARLEHPPRMTAVTTMEPATVGAVCVMYAWQIVRVAIG
jgi:hypothetical protein